MPHSPSATRRRRCARGAHSSARRFDHTAPNGVESSGGAAPVPRTPRGLDRLVRVALPGERPAPPACLSKRIWTNVGHVRDSVDPCVCSEWPVLDGRFDALPNDRDREECRGAARTMMRPRTNLSPEPAIMRGLVRSGTSAQRTSLWSEVNVGSRAERPFITIGVVGGLADNAAFRMRSIHGALSGDRDSGPAKSMLRNQIVSGYRPFTSVLIGQIGLRPSTARAYLVRLADISTFRSRSTTQREGDLQCGAAVVIHVGVPCGTRKRSLPAAAIAPLGTRHRPRRHR